MNIEKKKEQRRTLIKDTAFNLFASKGYGKTSMNDIVRASGVSKGGIYVYFTSKEEIFKEIAEDLSHSRQNLLESLDPGFSPEERFREFIEHIVKANSLEKSRERVAFTFEYWLEQKNNQKDEYIKNRFLHAQSQVESLLNEGVEQGVFHKDLNSFDLTHLLFSTIDGLAFYSSVLGKEEPQNLPQLVSDLFLSKIMK